VRLKALDRGDQHQNELMKQHPQLSFELLAIHADAGDLHGRERLTVPIQLLILLLTLVVEDQDFVGSPLFDYLSGNEGARRFAQFAFGAANRQHLVELNVFAAGLRQLLNLDYVAGCDALLLSPGADHRVHGNASQGRVSRKATDDLKLFMRLHFPSRKRKPSRNRVARLL